MTDYDLSIVIPSRNEEFLNRTIKDILAHKKAKTQIIVGLDGQWPVEPIKTNPDVVVLYYPESIGQRAITNQCVQLSRAKYIMKLDAHCALDDGFDQKMIEAFAKSGDDVVMAPTMRNLHVFNWKCPDGHIRYQGPSGPCKECGKETTKDFLWIAKNNPQSTSYCFDTEPHFQYFNEIKNRPEYKAQGDLTETMSLQGSCFMLTRELYWKLNICDEAFGTWGSQGIEVACKAWLTGRRVLVNHNTFYAHLFRTQGGDFGFPYELSGNQVSNAKKLAKEMFFDGRFKDAIRPVSWLVEKFWPVPSWRDEDLKKLKDAESLSGRSLGLIPSNSIANTTPSSVSNNSEFVSTNTTSLSGINSSWSVSTKNINLLGNELKMEWVATGTVVADMVKLKSVFSPTSGYWLNKESIQETMDFLSLAIVQNSSIPLTTNSITSPIPTSSVIINSDMGDNVFKDFGIQVVDNKKLINHKLIIPQEAKSPTIPTRGCIYYTDNQLDEKVMLACQKQLKKASRGIPIVSCSLKSIDFGKNILYPGQRGYLTMTKQILTALEALDTEIVYFAEHDVLYHPTHFDFIPEDRNTWYYESNYWFLRLDDGFAVGYDCSPLSGLVVYRDIAIKHFKERLALMEKDQFKEYSMYKIGFEPMTHKRIKWTNDYPFKTFMSSSPSIDISHGANVTRKRWSIDLFRKKPTRWVEGNIDTIEGWDNVRKLLK